MYPYIFETPHGIGPHEGHELDLMLTGTKPCACFHDSNPSHGIIPEKAFAPFVASGRIKRFETIYTPSDLPSPYQNMVAVYFCLPGKERHVARLQTLHELNRRGQWRAEHDIEEGRLLGYQERDIRAYMQRLSQFYSDADKGP